MSEETENTETPVVVKVPPVVEEDLTAPIKCDLRFKECEIELTLHDGSVQQCILREVNGLERDGYLSSLVQKQNFTEEGKPAGLKNLTNVQATLLSHGLLRIVKDATSGVLTREKYTVAQIQAFPSRAQDVLFIRLKKMSNIGDEEDVKAQAKKA